MSKTWLLGSASVECMVFGSVGVEEIAFSVIQCLTCGFLDPSASALLFVESLEVDLFGFVVSQC